MAKIKPKALLAQSKQKKGPSQISVTTYIVLGVLVVSSVYAAYKYWAGRGAAAAVGVEGN
jgi:ABC-type arginine transport system permease subunit